MAFNRRNNILNEDRSLSRYLNDIRPIPMISIDEEICLAKRIKKGDQIALTILVRSNLRFVITVAKKYRNKGLPLSDLINEGNLGLIQAALRFDETKGIKFISYAVWWIRQSIIQSIHDSSRLIRLPQNKIAALNKLFQAKKTLEQELEREPTSEEIAGRLETDHEEVQSLAKNALQTVSLDSPLKHNEASVLHELVEDPESEDPDADLLLQSFIKELNEVLSTLSDREANIIRLYYGINCDHPNTLEEISKHYRLTRERVRQIKERGLSKLRHRSRCRHLRAYLE